MVETLTQIDGNCHYCIFYGELSGVGGTGVEGVGMAVTLNSLLLSS
jgi:hypothetical protein